MQQQGLQLGAAAAAAGGGGGSGRDRNRNGYCYKSLLNSHNGTRISHQKGYPKATGINQSLTQALFFHSELVTASRHLKFGNSKVE
jgi:hypothetical protein